MAGAGVPVPSADDGAIVVAPQACFKVESHENGVVIHLQRGGPRGSWRLRGLEEMRGQGRGAPQRQRGGTAVSKARAHLFQLTCYYNNWS